LRSDREHCASRVAVEQDEEERRRRRTRQEEATDIKSNNPHLAGREKLKIGFLKPSSKAEQGGQNATKNSQVYRFIQYPCWLLNFVPAFSPLHAAVSPEIAMQRERERRVQWVCTCMCIKHI